MKKSTLPSETASATTFDSNVFLDVVLELLGDDVPAVVEVGEHALSVYINALSTLVGRDAFGQAPVVLSLFSRLSHACHHDPAPMRHAGAVGAAMLVRRLPYVRVREHALDVVRALMTTIKDERTEASSRTSRLVYNTIDFIIRVCLGRGELEKVTSSTSDLDKTIDTDMTDGASSSATGTTQSSSTVSSQRDPKEVAAQQTAATVPDASLLTDSESGSDFAARGLDDGSDPLNQVHYFSEIFFAFLLCVIQGNIHLMGLTFVWDCTAVHIVPQDAAPTVGERSTNHRHLVQFFTPEIISVIPSARALACHALSHIASRSMMTGILRARVNILTFYFPPCRGEHHFSDDANAYLLFVDCSECRTDALSRSTFENDGTATYGCPAFT